MYGYRTDVDYIKVIYNKFGHLLFVFTLVQTPFITFKTTKKPNLSTEQIRLF